MSGVIEIHLVSGNTYAEPIVSMARAKITTSWSSPWSMLAFLGALKDLAFSVLFMACKYARASRQKQRSPELVSSRSGSEATARALKAFNRSLNLLEPLAYRDRKISKTGYVIMHSDGSEKYWKDACVVRGVRKTRRPRKTIGKQGAAKQGRRKRLKHEPSRHQSKPNICSLPCSQSVRR